MQNEREMALLLGQGEGGFPFGLAPPIAAVQSEPYSAQNAMPLPGQKTGKGLMFSKSIQSLGRFFGIGNKQDGIHSIQFPASRFTGDAFGLHVPDRRPISGTSFVPGRKQGVTTMVKMGELTLLLDGIF